MIAAERVLDGTAATFDQAAGLAYAIDKGWLWRHESGTYVSCDCSRSPREQSSTIGTKLSRFRQVLWRAFNGAYIDCS